MIYRNTLRTSFNPCIGEYDIHLFIYPTHKKDGKKVYLDGLSSNTKFIEAGIDPGRSFSIDEEAAQGLIDDLYNAGLRPSNTEGVIATKDAHLQDMRRLVFKGKP